MGEVKAMKKYIVMIGILLLVICYAATTAFAWEYGPTQSKKFCKEMYDELRDSGYSHSEATEYLKGYGCHTHGNYWSDSSGSGGVCLIAPLLPFLLCGIFIVHYRKKHEMEK
jgi:cbb3-type cytochrome oxidase subunit 3